MYGNALCDAPYGECDAHMVMVRHHVFFLLSRIRTTLDVW
jgi:hypothetical protein